MASAASRHLSFFFPSNEFELELEARVMHVFPADETGFEVDGAVVDTDPWCLDGEGLAELFAGLESEGFQHVYFIDFVDILLQACNTSSPIDFEVSVLGPCIPRCEVEHMKYSNSASILIPNYEEGDYHVVISLTAPTIQQCYIDSIKLGKECVDSHFN